MQRPPRTAVEIRGTLGAEREAHSATEARLPEIRRQLDETSDQLTRVRTEFAAELDRARDRVTAGEERAASHEKRALLEIDQELTASQKCEKQIEELRTQLQTVRAERADAEVQVTRRLIDDMKKAPAGRSAPRQKPVGSA
jgi:DNA repair exonuclease SbcCD ATPase subunit